MQTDIAVLFFKLLDGITYNRVDNIMQDLLLNQLQDLEKKISFQTLKYWQ